MLEFVAGVTGTRGAVTFFRVIIVTAVKRQSDSAGRAKGVGNGEGVLHILLVAISPLFATPLVTARVTVLFIAQRGSRAARSLAGFGFSFGAAAIRVVIAATAAHAGVFRMGRTFAPTASANLFGSGHLMRQEPAFAVAALILRDASAVGIEEGIAGLS